MLESMIDNLTVLAVIVIVLWIATLLYYYRVSRQQREIQEELDALRVRLEETEGRGE